MKHTDVIIAAAAGVLVGAAIGIIFAPKKGEDLRSDICDFLKSKGIRLKKNRMEKLIDEIAEEIK